MLKKTLSSTLALACAGALAAAAPAAAKPVAYHGKTSGQTKITFKRTGGTVTALRTYVPVVCASSRTSDTMTGSDAYVAPAAVAIGPEQTFTADQPSSFGSAQHTKHYRMTLTKGRGGSVRGTLHVNFMTVQPFFNAWGYLDGNTFVCQGDATFTARPKKAARRKKR